MIQAKRSLGGKRLIGRKEQDMIKFQYIYIFDAYSFPDHDLFCGWLILVVSVFQIWLYPLEKHKGSQNTERGR